MPKDPIDLDERRGKSAREAAETRRQRVVEAHDRQVAADRRQHEIERELIAAPAKSRSDAVVRARYLLQLFAATKEGQDPRRRELIALALEDLTRLGDNARRWP